jgi:hypothetical protein
LPAKAQINDKNICTNQTPQLTSVFAPSRTTILYFKGPRSRKIAEFLAEIPDVAVAKMGLSHLFNI